MERLGYSVGWNDVSDLVIPMAYINYLFDTMNRIRMGLYVFTDDAYEKYKKILIALSQKVLRYTTEIEKERFLELLSLY